jgi:hypothetical protein
MKLVTDPSTRVSLRYYKTGSWNVMPCFIFLARQPLVSLGRLLIKPARSHSDTPHSIGLLWTSDRPVEETSIWQHNTHKRQTFTSPAGFDPAILASERPQTHTLNRAATGIGRDTLHSYTFTEFLPWSSGQKIQAVTSSKKSCNITTIYQAQICRGQVAMWRVFFISLYFDFPFLASFY